MELTSGTRATGTTAAAVMLGGVGLTLHGVWRDEAPSALAGIVLSMIALTGIILAVVHHWITDTRTERAILAAAQRETQAERTRYIAAQAALEGEQARLYRDLAAERAADKKRLAEERAAMSDEFEDARSALSGEAMALLTSWIRGGKVRPPENCDGNLIQFPKQAEERERTATPQQQRTRAREHGVVGP